MTLGRRSFLQGLLLGTTAATATALVQLASPDDVQWLRMQPSDVLLGRPEVPAHMPDLYNPEVYMRLPRTNEMVMVGYLKSLQIATSMLEATSWDGEFVGEVRGLRRIFGTIGGLAI